MDQHLWCLISSWVSWWALQSSPVSRRFNSSAVVQDQINLAMWGVKKELRHFPGDHGWQEHFWSSHSIFWMLHGRNGIDEPSLFSILLFLFLFFYCYPDFYRMAGGFAQCFLFHISDINSSCFKQLLYRGFLSSFKSLHHRKGNSFPAARAYLPNSLTSL